MKKAFLVIIISIISLGSYAGFVRYDKAAKVATAHYYKSMYDVQTLNLSNLDLNCVSNPEFRNSDFSFYIFDFQHEDNLGYVIVSSDDKIKPILAYSLSNNFDATDIAPPLRSFFEYYQSCIELVSTRADIPVDESVSKEWDSLLEYDFSKTRSEGYISPRLLEDIGIKWNQGSPYNGMCPKDQKAQGGRVPAGCVAIAACQVMKYYNWPPKGEGAKTHKSNYGYKSVNFHQETYNWSAIPVKGSNTPIDELAKICYHVGVALEMGWGPKGSGAQTAYVAAILREHFRYSSKTEFVSRENMSDKDWGEVLKAEIDAKRPMVYRGTDNKADGGAAGHAWNCDGYQIHDNGNTYFHMNWGWGGSGNNYCTLDNLVSKAIGSGPQYNFVDRQGVVKNIYPKAFANHPYPDFCNGTRLITGQEGCFGDGSGVEKYKTNTEATYILKPSSCGTVIDFDFAKFDIAEGDDLFMYDGEGENIKMLAQFNSENVPTSKSKFKAYDAATIKFVTKDKGGADGWAINYKISNCLNSDGPFTDPIGKLSDGSGQDCNYEKATRCKWLIKPEGAKSIKINIDKFDIDENDIFQIYKGNTTSSTARIVRIEKGAVPEEYYIVGSEEEPVSEVTISFIAKQTSPGAPGWQISYSANGLTGIEEEYLSSDFDILPNPVNKQSKLIISAAKTSDFRINIIDIMGKTIGEKEIFLLEGSHELPLSEITNTNLEAGVYFVSIYESNNNFRTKKFVVVE